jgi:hypothetical protein
MRELRGIGYAYFSFHIRASKTKGMGSLMRIFLKSR